LIGRGFSSDRDVRSKPARTEEVHLQAACQRRIFEQKSASSFVFKAYRRVLRRSSNDACSVVAAKAPRIRDNLSGLDVRYEILAVTALEQKRKTPRGAVQLTMPHGVMRYPNR